MEYHLSSGLGRNSYSHWNPGEGKMFLEIARFVFLDFLWYDRPDHFDCTHIDEWLSLQVVPLKNEIIQFSKKHLQNAR